MADEISADRLVPFRWPAGWTDPKLITLLEGGPINCLLVDTVAMGKDGMETVAGAGRKAGLVVRDWRTLGAGPLSEIKWNTSSSAIVITGLVWPRIRLSPAGGPNAAVAGPTGAPWIDSNCWVARLARVRAPGKQIWLGFEPSKDGPAPSEAAYQLAVADSAAAGARWMVGLDDGLSKGLAAGSTEAMKTWRSLLATLSFFEKHRDWNTYEPWGAVGILSTFAGDSEFLGSEVLNLAARRNLLYRVLDRSFPGTQKLEGLRAVLYADNEQPSVQLKTNLTAFARSGGRLIVPRAVAPAFTGERILPCPVVGYELRSLGKGAVATATQDWEDPHFLAEDVHSLVGRLNDPVLLFNARSLWEHFSVAPRGQDRLLQLVGFTGRPNASVSVAVRLPPRTATMYVAESDAGAVLEPITVEGRVEYHLPPFTLYAALEFRQ